MKSIIDEIEHIIANRDSSLNKESTIEYYEEAVVQYNFMIKTGLISPKEKNLIDLEKKFILNKEFEFNKST